jgi:hypothetical protein
MEELQLLGRHLRDGGTAAVPEGANAVVQRAGLDAAGVCGWELVLAGHAAAAAAAAAAATSTNPVTNPTPAEQQLDDAVDTAIELLGELAMQPQASTSDRILHLRI